jgi:biotin-dependent carboxylase-like uncharacterized protein
VNPAGDAPAEGAHPAYAHLEVIDPGTLTLVEDLGRTGYAAMGVSPSGAADRGSFALGARLLGQETDRAALECHLGGLALRAHGSVTIALTGATAPATVDGVPAPQAAPLLLRDGSVLRLGRPTAGLRTYLSVRGAVDEAPVPGSRSYATLSGIGPLPLEPGRMLPVGTPSGSPLVDVAPIKALPHGAVELTVTPGPRLDWLDDPAFLTTASWSVGADSDRVGVRLEGEPLRRAQWCQELELPSEGVVRGAVQLPADGQPVAFLADHPVTGGYPVVAVLTAAATDQLAQLVPGQQVRLRLDPSRLRT